jgi:hypothetical protein
MTMFAASQSIIDTRRHQMFPVLEPSEIERVRRFGVVRSYAAGEALAKVGEVGHGLTSSWPGKSTSPSTTSDRIADWLDQEQPLEPSQLRRDGATSLSVKMLKSLD